MELRGQRGVRVAAAIAFPPSLKLRRTEALTGERFTHGRVDLVDADRLHADIVGAGGLAVIVRADAGRAGKLRIDRARGPERLIEPRRLRSKQHDGRKPGGGGKMRRTGVV